MADDFNTALSTPLPEGVRRILLVISWPSFILLSIIIVIFAFARFYDSGYEYPFKSNSYAGITEIRPDGTKYIPAFDPGEWSLSNISPATFLLIPGAAICVFAARWICFKAFHQIVVYIWAVLWWVVIGFKNKGG
jgi:hypothetical protein